jgi:hypothetical protein
MASSFVIKCDQLSKEFPAEIGRISLHYDEEERPNASLHCCEEQCSNVSRRHTYSHAPTSHKDAEIH